MLKCLLAKLPRQTGRCIPCVATGSQLDLATSPRLDSASRSRFRGGAFSSSPIWGYMIRPMCPHPQDDKMSEVRLQGIRTVRPSLRFGMDCWFAAGDYLRLSTVVASLVFYAIASLARICGIDETSTMGTFGCSRDAPHQILPHAFRRIASFVMCTRSCHVSVSGLPFIF